MANIFILHCNLYDKDMSIKIHNSNTSFYTLKEAEEYGKTFLKECYIADNNLSMNDISKISEIDIDKYLNTHSYDFSIEIISGNRKRFNTSMELISYFISYIKFIKYDKLYDFLLSLVEFDIRFYDCKGNFIGSDILQMDIKSNMIGCPELKFSIESCREGKYRFLSHNCNYEDIIKD